MGVDKRKEHNGSRRAPAYSTLEEAMFHRPLAIEVIFFDSVDVALLARHIQRGQVVYYQQICSPRKKPQGNLLSLPVFFHINRENGL